MILFQKRKSVLAGNLFLIQSWLDQNLVEEFRMICHDLHCIICLRQWQSVRNDRCCLDLSAAQCFKRDIPCIVWKSLEFEAPCTFDGDLSTKDLLVCRVGDFQRLGRSPTNPIRPPLFKSAIA